MMFQGSPMTSEVQKTNCPLPPAEFLRIIPHTPSDQEYSKPAIGYSTPALTPAALVSE
jgi:hypothetical protein